LNTGDGLDGTAAFFGDGNYAYTVRVAGLPIYKDEGRHLLHLGFSYTYRRANEQEPTVPNTGGFGPNIVRFSARPELRDAIGDFARFTTSGSGTGLQVLPGNGARLVDTGTFAADSTSVFDMEFLYILGPFFIQSELAYAKANDAQIGAVHKDLNFYGGYVQASYILTGENRLYDTRLGRLGTAYLDVNTPFWFVRDEDGHLSAGSGAWEVATRYSWLNLNDGPVTGGKVNGWEVALNWYLNDSLKIQFEYMHNNRYDMKPNTIPGNVDGLATRIQWLF
jgi:phosphate-selective porin OprO/OprP